MGSARSGLAIAFGGGLALLAALAWRWTTVDAPAERAPVPAARDKLAAPMEVALIPPTQASTPPEDSRRPSTASEALDAPLVSAPDGFELSGLVADDLGLAIDRFDLDLEGPDGRATSTWPQAGRADPPSSSGRFALRRLAPGEWKLTARVPETRRRSAPSVVVVPGAEGELRLIVPRAAAIAGFVVDAAGVPIADAEVHVRDLRPATDIRKETGGVYLLGYGSAPEPMARTDRAGAFRIEDVPPGAHDVMARHESYCVSEWSPVEAAPGETARVDLRLGSGGRIVGRVEPTLGRVSGREIGLYGFRGKHGWRDTTTEIDGSFAIGHVVPQDYVIDLHPLEAAENDHAAATRIRRRITVLEGETLEVVFDRAASPVDVHGVALLAGVPAPGLDVRAHRLDGDDLGERATTGADGRFSVTLAAAGRYEFIVSSDDASHAYFESEVPDAPAHEVAFDLPGARVAGRVTDSDGRPLSRVPITLRGGGSFAAELDLREHLRRTSTAADGTFAISLLAPGTYTLRAPDGRQLDVPAQQAPHGRTLEEFELAPLDTRHVEVRLPPEGHIAGVVVDALGTPRAQARIGALDEQGRELSAFGWEAMSDSSGAFEIHSLAAGTYVLWVRSDDVRSTHPALEVEAGRTTTARLVAP